VREALRVLLEKEGFDVVAEASDGNEAQALARQHQPDVAVLDLAMPNLNGLETARGLKDLCPGIRTVALTAHDDEAYVQAALEAGITGYVLKWQTAAQLAHAIREVCHGAVYLSPGTSRALTGDLARGSPPSRTLTRREREILQLIAESKTTKEVAHLLGISVKTADSHRFHIMRKLDIHDTAGLVRYAIRNRLIQP
jgi:DNA-binding NarL/FixJ family response regulator